MEQSNSFVGIALVVIGIVAVGLLAMGLTDTSITVYQEDEHVNTMSVNGTSMMDVAPDLAIVSTGVSALEDDAYSAQQAANAIMDGMIEALIALGLEESDIETTQMSLYEETEWSKEEIRHIGWRATQMISISTSDLELVGPIIDAATDNGANTINGVTFTLSEESREQYYQEALSLASENAKVKAEAMVLGVDADVGKVVSMSEVGVYYTPYDVRNEDIYMDAGSTTPATVMPGDVTLSASVAVTFEIN